MADAVTDPPRGLFADPPDAAELFDVLLDPARDWPARWPAAEAVVAHFAPRILRWAAKATRDADDIASEVTYKVLRQLEARNWDRQFGFGRLIATMTRNEIANYHRNPATDADGGDDDDPTAALAGPDDFPTDPGGLSVIAATLQPVIGRSKWKFRLADLEKGLGIVMALRRLTPDGRRVVEGRILDEEASAAVGARVNRTEQAVNTQLDRFKQYVAEEVARIQELVPAVRAAWFDPPFGPGPREDGDIADAILAALGRQDGVGHQLLRLVAVEGADAGKAGKRAGLDAAEADVRLTGFRADVVRKHRDATAARLVARFHPAADDLRRDALAAQARAALEALTPAELEAVRLTLVADRPAAAAAARTGLDEFDVQLLAGRVKKAVLA